MILKIINDIQEQIEDVMNVTDVEYGLLYSLYSWPNVVLPVFGGYLIDKVFGLRIATVIFIAFCVVGKRLWISFLIIGWSLGVSSRRTSKLGP